MVCYTEKEAEAACKAYVEELKGEYINFRGNNCYDPCDGWDGDSHRCQCGNRRIEWCFDERYDGTWYYYAEAY